MTFPNPELLLIVENVAREKNIDREDVFIAMEQAIQRAGRTRYGNEQDIRSNIDRADGTISLKRYREVVETPENDVTQISLPEAQKISPDCATGDFLTDALPPVDFGRIAAQTARQVIVQQVREVERQKQYDEYKDRVGEVVSGIVKRIEYGHAIIDLGRGEGILKRDEIIPRENFRTGDRVTCYFYEARRENYGPQLFLSRTHPQFMVRLFEQEVPEIHEGIITIHGCARDPGSRAKISVESRDPGIDPVGACVGMRGSRVQAVVNEFQGEKVDIIPWSPDVATYIVNALAPAEVSKVILDDESNHVEIIVPEEQLSQAIGRRGQNVRLASMLTNMEIDIMTEEQEQERRQKIFEEKSKLLVDTLNVDDVLARLLIGEGIDSARDIAETTAEWLTEIEGFDLGLAEELITRAQKYVEEEHKANLSRLKDMKVEQKLIDFWPLALPLLIRLAENKIKNVEDLAGLASDELTNAEDSLIKGEGISSESANKIIMEARVASGWLSAEEAEKILNPPQEKAEETEETDPTKEAEPTVETVFGEKTT